MATEKSTSPSTAKKGPSRATKSAVKKSSGGAKRASAPRAEAPRRKSATQVAGQAARQLLELTGKEPEGVTGLERTDDGWTVSVEVVEMRRVPSTTDVLATYEVEVDSDGDLQGYRRVRRYVRGTPGEE